MRALPAISFIYLSFPLELVALLLPFLLVNGVQGKDYLYLDNPNNKQGIVQEYVNTNTESSDQQQVPVFLRNQNEFRFVVFYSPACPHCVQYAPEYMHIAQQIILNGVSDNVKFYAVSCKVHHKLCRQFPIRSYPTILAIRSGTNATNGATTMEHNLNLESFLEVLNKTTTATAFRNPKARNTETSITRLRYEGDEPFASNQHLIFQDAATSFYFTLTNGIFMEVGPLNHEKREAFRHFLTVLQYTLPSENSSMGQLLDMVDDIMDNLEDVTNDEDTLLNYVKQHLSSADRSMDFEWTEACTHGQSSMGYTCGLWELFHIITVGITIRLRDSSSGVITTIDNEVYPNAINNAAISAKFVGDAIRDFVLHFFGCRECSTHFVQMYDTCQHDVCNRLLPSSDWREAALWLWQAHNTVNVRLARERLDPQDEATTREETLKWARWPSRRECPKCWMPDNGWDSAIVYNYLKKTYWYEHSGSGLNNEAVGRKEEKKAQIIAPPKNSVAILLISLSLFALSIQIYRRRRRKTCGLHKKLDLPMIAHRNE